MPVVRVLPNATTTYGGPSVTGAATAHEALSDTSDASYIRRAHPSYDQVVDVEMATSAITSTHDIVTLMPGFRYKAERSGVLPYTLIRTKKADGTFAYGRQQQAGYAPTITDFAPSPSLGQYVDPATGLAWEQAAIDSMLLSLKDQATPTDGSRAYFYKSWVDIYHLAPLTAALTAPAATVADTTKPTLSGTVSGLVESWQGTAVGTEINIEWIIYPQSVVDAAPGFSAWAGTAGAVDSGTLQRTHAYIDGSTPSVASFSVQPAVSLPVGEALRLYARARRSTFGKWATATSLQFTITLTPPAAPTITWRNDRSVGKVRLSVTPNSSAGYASPRVDIERSMDDGATWRAPYGLTDRSSAFGVIGSHDDYTCPRIQHGPNQVRNPGFEENTGGLATGWTVSSGVTATSSLYADGTKAQRLRYTAVTGDSGKILVMHNSDWFPVVGGKRYVVKFRGFGTVGNCTFKVGIMTRTADGTILGYHEMEQTMTGSAQDFWQSHVLGATAAQAFIRIVFTGVTYNATPADNSSFDVWIDDAFFSEPLAVQPRYRARVRATKDGNEVASAWSDPVTQQVAGYEPSGWWFKVPDAPSMNMGGVRVVGRPEEQIEEDVTVFRIKDSDRPVVVAGEVYGADGTYRVIAYDTEIPILEAIARYQDPVYVDSPFGDSKWIRIIGRNWTRSGTTTRQRREYDLTYVEIAEP